MNMIQISLTRAFTYLCTIPKPIRVVIERYLSDAHCLNPAVQDVGQRWRVVWRTDSIDVVEKAKLQYAAIKRVFIILLLFLLLVLYSFCNLMANYFRQNKTKI